MVELRYKGKPAKLEQQINEAEKTLESIRRKWTDARIGDLEEKIITLKESLERNALTLERQTKQAQKRFNQAVRRTAHHLVAEQRITRRSLDAGRKRELDSEDEGSMNLFSTHITGCRQGIFSIKPIIADTSKEKGSFDQRQALRPEQDQQIKDHSKPSGI